MVELSEETPTKAELLAAMEQHGREAAFNRAGVRYRELGLAERITALSTDEMLKLLSEDWRLLKRPFFVADSGEVTLGFKAPRET